ncbi:protocadherin-11 X-linked-like [Polypterus senegalus]|uniref:protocadherin-11 X-linked-like n=1 Tax=Polypterus senegalus TaxID=55291 RepID=UPI001962EE7E|nr:protocadherin-11 X-linked-like [Polypterus senegalus]
MEQETCNSELQEPPPLGHIEDDTGPLLPPHTHSTTKQRGTAVTTTVTQQILGSITFSKVHVSIPENSPINTVVSEASDPDVPDVNFMIVGVQPEFTIDTTSGIIKTQQIFDFESGNPNAYLLLVKAWNATYQSTGNIDINISNVNEAPVCTQPDFVAGKANVTINENYPVFDVVYTIQATDQDVVHGDKLNYSIQSQVSTSSACQSVFTINRNTGVVYRSPGTVLDYDAGCQ